MRTSRRLALRLALAIPMGQLALWVPGCKINGERPRELGPPPPGGIFSQTLDGGKRGIDGGGMVLVQAMPDDFPKDIPLYPDSTVALGGRVTGPGGKPSWSLTVTTADPKQQAITRYAAVLKGFEKGVDLDMGDSELSVWKNAAYDVIVMYGTSVDGKTTVTLNVASK